MIQVRVPLDLHAVASAQCAAFAFATPVRVGELLVMAIREALGERAPRDKFERSLLRIMLGFSRGEYLVDIDGRRFAHPDQTVLCEGTASIRFFLAAHSTR